MIRYDLQGLDSPEQIRRFNRWEKCNDGSSNKIVFMKHNCTVFWWESLTVNKSCGAIKCGQLCLQEKDSV